MRAQLLGLRKLLDVERCVFERDELDERWRRELDPRTASTSSSNRLPAAATNVGICFDRVENIR